MMRTHGPAGAGERIAFHQGTGEAQHRLVEAAASFPRSDHRVEEIAEKGFHDRDDEVVAIAEVHVERAARVAGAGADGVEAGDVEAVLEKLREPGADQGRARLAL